MAEGTSFIDQSFKDKDLTPNLMASMSSPKKTWFLKRSFDGKILAVEERAASEMVYNIHRVLRGRRWKEIEYEIVGVSDGKTYNRVVRESGSKADIVMADIKKLRVEQDRFKKTEENMVFNDLVDINDKSPQATKLKRVKEIIADYDKKLDALENTYKSLTSQVNKLAFDEEFKVAQANVRPDGSYELPTNHNILTPNASPAQRQRIVNNLPA